MVVRQVAGKEAHPYLYRVKIDRIPFYYRRMNSSSRANSGLYSATSRRTNGYASAATAGTSNNVTAFSNVGQKSSSPSASANKLQAPPRCVVNHL